MYKWLNTSRYASLGFNQPRGLHMDSENRWVRMADRVPWDEFECRHVELFESDIGSLGKPLRRALGCLIIQTWYQYKESTHYQYLKGLAGYQEKVLVDTSTWVIFQEHLIEDIFWEANEYLLEKHEGNQDDGQSTLGSGTEEGCNSGTLILDATCSPVDIRYPQGFELLNEARKSYLAMAKMKKRSAKKIRAMIRGQPSYVRRDLKYVDGLKKKGYEHQKREA